MCLVLKADEVKVAESDIICYKVVLKTDEDFVTYYRRSKVKLGCTYESELVVEDGFNTSLNQVKVVEKGLHTFDCTLHASYFMDSNFNQDSVLIQCVIPKGSKYYVGCFNSYYNSYASEKLVYVKVIDKLVRHKNLGYNVADFYQYQTIK